MKAKLKTAGKSMYVTKKKKNNEGSGYAVNKPEEDITGDFFLYNSCEDEAEALQVLVQGYGRTDRDYERNSWYSHG